MVIFQNGMMEYYNNNGVTKVPITVNVLRLKDMD